MISVDIVSDNKLWNKRIKKTHLFFNTLIKLFPKKYKFVNNLTGDTGYNINVPVGNNSGFVGQQEIIEKDFIDIEVEKAVNDFTNQNNLKLNLIENRFAEIIT